MKKHFGHRLIKKRQSRYHTSLPRMGKGDRISGARVLSYAEQMRLSFPGTTICLSCHSHPIRPCGAPSPRGEGCDTRIPSSKKSAIPPACESFRPRVSSSRADEKAPCVKSPSQNKWGLSRRISYHACELIPSFVLWSDL